MARDRWDGRVFLSPGRFVYCGASTRAGEHAHHAVQFVWALDQPIRVRLGSRTLKRRALLVPSNVPHSFDGEGSRFLIMLIEAQSPIGRALDAVAQTSAGRDLHARLADLTLPDLRAPTAEIQATCDAILARLQPVHPLPPLSMPVRRALRYFDTRTSGLPRLPDAASFAGVSPTRLTHLFSSEVGLPFRRFVLWWRIKRAVEKTRVSTSLTETAVAAGFSDAAHMSRTFRATFGMAPSLILPIAEIVESRWADASSAE